MIFGERKQRKMFQGARDIKNVFLGAIRWYTVSVLRKCIAFIIFTHTWNFKPIYFFDSDYQKAVWQDFFIILGQLAVTKHTKTAIHAISLLFYLQGVRIPTNEDQQSGRQVICILSIPLPVSGIKLLPNCPKKSHSGN
jgi:hypothetical protein